MSEYQYYEFRTVDRPLTSREMGELRDLSTRADITPNSFTNEYHFGDFRGSPEKLMHKYFDAFVYVANWGTHRLMLRLPRDLLDDRTVKPYLLDPGMTADAKGDHVVLEFRSDDESGDWEEEGGQFMADLLPVRESLLSGDLRALYIGWLAAVQYDGEYGGGYDEDDEYDDGDDEGAEESEDDDRPEPPVPQ